MTRWPAPRSVRLRLTLWHAGLLAALLCAYAAGVFAWTRHDAFSRVDLELAGDFAEIAAVLAIDDSGNYLLPSELEEQEADESKLVELRDGAGALLLRLPSDVPPTVADPDWAPTGDTPVTAHLTDGSRVRALRQQVVLGGRDHRFEVAHSLAAVDAKLDELALVLGLCIPVGVALAALAGSFLAGRALAPVDRLAEQARRITAERLSERLPIADPSDELGRLATAFNEMLIRLDRSFEQLRRFTADASHELRTPLTAMRLVGENALRHGALPAAARDVVGSMLEEVDRLARLVDDLLLLARADAGQPPAPPAPCDLAELARDVAEQLGVLAEEKQLELRVVAPTAAPVLGDPLLLRQALQNLVGNAIRHGPAGSAVVVTVAADAREARVAVADLGDGIPLEHRVRVFERFFRVDAARARAHGGAGLGLAIAKWIVDAHRGRLDVVATREAPAGERPGATFRMHLPLAIARAS